MSKLRLANVEKAKLRKVQSSPHYGDIKYIFKKKNSVAIDEGKVIEVTRKISYYPYYKDLKPGDEITLVTDEHEDKCVVTSMTIARNNDYFNIYLRKIGVKREKKEYAWTDDFVYRYKPRLEKIPNGPWQKPYKGLTWRDMPPRLGCDLEIKKLNFALFRRGLVKPQDFLSDKELMMAEMEDLEAVDVDSLSGVDKFLHLLKIEYKESLNENR